MLNFRRFHEIWEFELSLYSLLFGVLVIFRSFLSAKNALNKFYIAEESIFDLAREKPPE
jgi:hypothetical protein